MADFGTHGQEEKVTVDGMVTRIEVDPMQGGMNMVTFHFAKTPEAFERGEVEIMRFGIPDEGIPEFVSMLKRSLRDNEKLAAQARANRRAN